GRRGQGMAIRGDASGGSIVYGAMDGESTFTVIGHTRNGAGASTVVPGNVSFTQPEAGGWLFTVQDTGSTLELDEGVTFSNVEVQVGGGSTLVANGATFSATGTRH